MVIADKALHRISPYKSATQSRNRRDLIGLISMQKNPPEKNGGRLKQLKNKLNFGYTLPLVRLFTV
jgi:hypothetical protein